VLLPSQALAPRRSARLERTTIPISLASWPLLPAVGHDAVSRKRVGGIGLRRDIISTGLRLDDQPRANLVVSIADRPARRRTYRAAFAAVRRQLFLNALNTAIEELAADRRAPPSVPSRRC